MEPDYPYEKHTTSPNNYTNIIEHNAVKEFNFGYIIVEISQFLKMKKQISEFDFLGIIICKRAQDRLREPPTHFSLE